MLDASATTPPSPPEPTRRNRRLLLARAALLTALIAPIVLSVSVWVVTRSWFIILMTEHGLEERLGGEVTIDSAAYRGDGVFVFDDILLTARNQVGPAAKVLRIGRAEVTVNMGHLLTEGLQIQRVVVDGLLLRLSEDTRSPGMFNLGGLEPDWSVDSGGEPVPPPSVWITSAVIEMGTHIGPNYRPIGQRRFSGKMYPSEDDPSWYRFILQELDADNLSLGSDGLLIDGQWNVETLEHTARITGIALDDRTYNMCPQMARLWWDRMQPEGPVGTAVIQWKQGEPPIAELQVDRMALNIPVAAKEFSASYQEGKVEAVASMPRMHVHSGKIRLEGNQLTLDNLLGEFSSSSLRKDLIGMPYRVNLSIHDLPTFDWENQHDWMEQVVTAAPFEMSIRMENFSLTQDPESPPPVVELPRQVAEVLAKFNLTGWSLSTMVEIKRAAPQPDDDGALIPGPIETTGQAYISDAVGAFQGFPYPLEDVDAYVEFDKEQVTLHYMTAKGSKDSSLRISGTISPPGSEAAISLRLTARDVPLDDRFRRGLHGGQLDTYDLMLHKLAYESLLAEGLLPDADAIEAARKTRSDKVAELTRLNQADGGEDVEQERLNLKRQIASLGTLIEAGPFELGGHVDLDLAVERQRGPDNKTEITGTVNIQDAGVVYKRFPYPIYALGGKLIVEPDRVTIDPGPDGRGIPIATPGGGRGTVTGSVRLLPNDSGGTVEPDLEIDLRGDYLSDLLYAAMPLTDKERAVTSPTAERGTDRSLIARLLAGAGLSGWLNHTGHITAGPDGAPQYDFAVELYDGKAEPSEELFETMRELGLPSPTGVTLDDVNALLRITSDQIRLADFVGSRGSARITADASVNLKADPIETELDIEFDDLELERYMVELTPGDRQRTAALWDRYQPQGRYDARLRYSAVGAESEGAELTIWPQELRVMVEQKPVWLMCDRGEISLHGDHVNFSDMVIDVRGDERNEGVLTLDGSYGLASGNKGLELKGSWTGGQLASPLITESLRLIGAERHAERYRGYLPAGSFDADFAIRTAGGGPKEYEFTVKPDTIGLRIDDTTVYADLDPGSEISFTPGRIVVRNVAGEHAGGRFRIDGGIDVDSGIDADLELSYEGRIDSPQLLVVLPAKVRSVIETLKFNGAEPVKLTDGHLQLAQLGAGDQDPVWDLHFGGLLETHGAGLTLGGIEFTDLDGKFEVVADNDRESGPSLDVNIQGDRVLAKERELTNVEGRILLAQGGKVIEVPMIRADAYGGVVTGYAMIGLEPDGEYEAAVDIGAVSLAGFTSPKKAADKAAADKEAGRKPGQLSDGPVYGSLHISGRRGSPETRRGRGAMRVAYGRMADMPVTLRVLQLFELMPPLMGNLDWADIQAYVDGDRIVFERLYLECPTLQFIGEGEMKVPGFELDVRFKTHGTLPVWGDLVAGLSDQLFVVEVSGPINDPQAKLIPLPGIGPGKAPRMGAVDGMGAVESDGDAQAQADYPQDK